MAARRREIDAHREFHVEAGKIALLINATKYPEAERALANGTSSADISSQVGMALMALKKAAKL